MSKYTPDTWIVIKFTSPTNITYKVFGGWYGGYAKGDSWQLNSGIESIKIKENSYEFIGYSGSIYECYKNSENRLTMYHDGIIASIRKSVAEAGDAYSMEIIPSDSPEFVSLAKGM
jgi:hypothetical protein